MSLSFHLRMQMMRKHFCVYHDWHLCVSVESSGGHLCDSSPFFACLAVGPAKADQSVDKTPAVLDRNNPFFSCAILCLLVCSIRTEQSLRCIIDGHGVCQYPEIPFKIPGK